MENEVFVATVMAVVTLLFVAAISAVIMKRIKFPYTVGLVLVGVGIAFLSEDYSVLGETLEKLKFGPAMIMFLFVPILIFESAFNTDIRLLIRNLIPSLILAGPGLLLSTAVIGGLVHIFTELPLGSALVFGCLISATDPVAVIALFKEIGAPKRLMVLVEGESVFNDATAIVTFQILLAVIATGILDVQTVTGGALNFFVVFFGGLLVGLAFGYGIVKAISLIGDEPLVHITLTLATAYGAFIVADHFLETSGIMAVLGAGLVIGYYGPVLYEPRVKEYLEIFWEDAAFVANSLIFLMLGLSEKVFLAHTTRNVEGLLLPVLIVIAIVLFARFVVVYTLIPLTNAIPGGKPVDIRYRTVMAWGGLRGAIAVALAMSLPSHFPYRWQILDFTFGVVLFMLVFNGVTMSWLMRKLGLDKPSPLLDFTHTYGAIVAKRSALERLDGYQPVGKVSEDLFQRVRDNYLHRLRQLEAKLAELRRKIGDDPATRRTLLWLRAFSIQQQIYAQRYREGLLSLDALRELEWSLRQKEMGMNRRRPGIGPPNLPSDERFGMGLLRLMEQVLPRLNLFPGWQVQRMVDIHEEAATLTVASQKVLAEMGHIAEFSGAESEHLEECRLYFTQLDKLSMAKLEFVDGQFAGAADIVQERLLNKVARDGEKAVIQRSLMSGELPEILAENLEREIEKG
jgi:CPA1 family monovalent cation:H+ antiporter